MNKHTATTKAKTTAATKKKTTAREPLLVLGVVPRSVLAELRVQVDRMTTLHSYIDGDGERRASRGVQ